MTDKRKHYVDNDKFFLEIKNLKITRYFFKEKISAEDGAVANGASPQSTNP
mgnify:CR=1 FL=1